MEKYRGLYILETKEIRGLYGNIKLEALEKKFASAKCCMCCH